MILPPSPPAGYNCAISTRNDEVTSTAVVSNGWMLNLFVTRWCDLAYGYGSIDETGQVVCNVPFNGPTASVGTPGRTASGDECPTPAGDGDPR